MMRDSASVVVVLPFDHSNFLVPTVLGILKEFTLGNISCNRTSLLLLYVF